MRTIKGESLSPHISFLMHKLDFPLHIQNSIIRVTVCLDRKYPQAHNLGRKLIPAYFFPYAQTQTFFAHAKLHNSRHGMFGRKIPSRVVSL